MYKQIIRNPNRPDIGYLIMSVFSPVHILVTAPDGKRIGYDPATGQEINEISLERSIQARAPRTNT